MSEWVRSEWVRLAPDGCVVWRRLDAGREESMTYAAYLAEGGDALPEPEGGQ